MVYDNSPAPESGLYFNPYQWDNIGKFRPSLSYVPLGDGEADVNQFDRQTLLRVSRKLYATMPEVAAASQQLANLTVGLGFSPLFTGQDPTDQAWGETAEFYLENSFYNQCSPYGIAYDWRTQWKLVSFLVDRDGDVLMVPFVDRNGSFKIDFIESHRIGCREGQTTIEGGRYNCYTIADGVVKNSSGYPVAYQVLGDKAENDEIYSNTQAYLIYNPISFSKFRGLPILKAAMRDAASLNQLEDDLEMMSKVETSVYLTMKNETGQAPRNKITVLGQPTSNSTVVAPGMSKPIYENWVGGIRYVRTKDEIKSFGSSRPSDQIMKFLEHLSKGIMLATGIPYQWILNPESVSGAASRGVKEQITKAVQDRAQLLNKYAIIGLQKAVANGMVQGTIPANNKTDKRTNQPVAYQFQVSQAAELMLDVGYETQALINQYLTGLISADEILQKSGKRYKNTLAIRAKNVRQLLDTVTQLQEEYPEFKSSILNLMQKEDFVPPPLPDENGTQGKKTNE